MINKHFKKYIAYVLFGLFFATVLLGENVSAYNVTLNGITAANYYAWQTTPSGSHTYFGMNFTVDGKSYGITSGSHKCYCNSRNVANYVTPLGGTFPWQNFYAGNYDAYVVGNQLAIVFHFNSFNPGTVVTYSDERYGCHVNTNMCDLQDILCMIDNPQPQMYTMIAHAYSETGSFIEGNISVSTVSSGSNANVYRKDYGGYKFLGWKTDLNGGYVSNSDSYGATLYGNMTVYAIYKTGYTEEKLEPRTENSAYTISKDFSVTGGSYVESVSGGNLIEGHYNVSGEKITATYKHTLFQENPGGFSTAINYGTLNSDENASSSLNRFATVASGSEYVDKNNNVISKSVELSTKDEYLEPLCQRIKFNSSGWTYNLLQNETKTIIEKYRYEYNGYGEYKGKTFLGTISEKVENNGDPYIDYNSLASKNLEAGSEFACVYARRPWNFEVKPIETEEEKAVYAGEEIEPSFVVNIGKHETDYPITDIPNATIQVWGGIEGSETLRSVYENKTIHASDGHIEDDSGSYAYYNKDGGYKTNISGGKLLVEDVPAGTKYCTYLVISPTDSDNGYYSNFNRNATSSKKKCYIVAKRPTVQVWGGNVVAGKDIKSGIMKKDYGTFGSWGELAVVAGGKINGFASGASLADGQVSNVALNKLMVLTFADAQTTSYLGGDFNTNGGKIEKDKNAILKKIEMSHGALNTLPNSPITESAYVKINGDLTINEDIVYAEEATNLMNMPKLLVYATGNININCNVSRLDAILVADGTVNTCTDESGNTPDVNAKARSRQLVINGMIIANELLLYRTYGAANGGAINSSIPAEIINYDPLVELITMEEKDDGRSGLNVVYSQESAVRY